MYQSKLCIKIEDILFLVLVLELKNTLNLGFTVSKIRELGLSGVLSGSGYVILWATQDYCF